MNHLGSRGENAVCGNHGDFYELAVDDLVPVSLDLGVDADNGVLADDGSAYDGADGCAPLNPGSSHEVDTVSDCRPFFDDCAFIEDTADADSGALTVTDLDFGVDDGVLTDDDVITYGDAAAEENTIHDIAIVADADVFHPRDVVTDGIALVVELDVRG